MRRALPFLFVIMFIGCLSSSAFAWGRRGHGIVAEIAFQFLDSADKEKIRSYLGDMSLIDAANWMDEVRGTSAYEYTAPWHYVDFPKGTDYQPTDQPNLVNAITQAMKELEQGKGINERANTV